MKNILLLLMTMMVNTIFAQSIIKGKITDSNGENLIGVTVLVTGSTDGTLTDLNGDYKLELPAGEYDLKVSYVGYKEQTTSVVLVDKEVYMLNFLLSIKTPLSEIVVIGSRNENRTALETALPVDIISVSDLVQRSTTNRNWRHA